MSKKPRTSKNGRAKKTEAGTMAEADGQRHTGTLAKTEIVRLMNIIDKAMECDAEEYEKDCDGLVQIYLMFSRCLIESDL